jgi:hypothetical protein
VDQVRTPSRVAVATTKIRHSLGPQVGDYNTQINIFVHAVDGRAGTGSQVVGAVDVAAFQRAARPVRDKHLDRLARVDRYADLTALLRWRERV